MSPQKFFPDPGAGILGAIGIISFDDPDEPPGFDPQLTLTLLIGALSAEVFSLDRADQLHGCIPQLFLAGLISLLGFLMPIQPLAHDLLEELGNRLVLSVRRLSQLSFEPGGKLRRGELGRLHA